MKNLFILHTQYTIGLAAGLCINRFQSDFNELIIFSDFNCTNKIIHNISKTFHKILVFPGIYDVNNIKWRKKMEYFYKN